MTDPRPTRLVINCETGERTVIELTDEEIAQRELDAANALAEREAQEALEAQKAADKASALAKLAALGLTEAEAQALVN